MRLGKLDNDELERLVLSKFHPKRKESLAAPEIGVDCAALDLGSDIAVLSTDPITSSSPANLGRLSVHVSCNDAAAAGAEPVGLLVTLLAPPTATKDQIDMVANDLAEAAAEANVDVLGGHTEVTDSVTRMVTNTTVLARIPRNRMLKGLQPGDDLVMTKWAGLEGSALIAEDYADRLDGISKEELDTAKSFSRFFSVVPEGLYASEHGATAMHDITEGGVCGAAWEMGYAAGLGIELWTDLIPVLPETLHICRTVGIDPFRLISSGSMLISCPDGESMVKGLESEGIHATIIGKVTGSGLHTKDGTEITPPGADELYCLFPS